jgi:drug/metabolite transporter (DMT)-like permease
VVLLTVPFAWGTYTPVVKYLYTIQEPPVPGLIFSAAYYMVAAVSLWVVVLVQPHPHHGGPQRQRNDIVHPRSNDELYTTTKVRTTIPKALSSLQSFPWRGGLELGSYLFVANVLQVVGLQTVPADRAGFLIQLTTVLVPVIDAIVTLVGRRGTSFDGDGGTIATSTSTGTSSSTGHHHHHPSNNQPIHSSLFRVIPKRTWMACGLASLGVVVFDWDVQDWWTTLTTARTDDTNVVLTILQNALVPSMGQLSTGDGCIVMAACIYSLHVVRLGRYAKESTALKLATTKATVEATFSIGLVLGLLTLFGDVNELPAVTTAATATTGWIRFASEAGHDITRFISSISSFVPSDGTDTIYPVSVWVPAWGAVLWTGWVTCAYTIYAQSFGQSRVQPTDANLIYSAQPLFTALFAFALLGETLSPSGVVGASLIGAAVYMVAVTGDDDDSKYSDSTDAPKIAEHRITESNRVP